MLDRAQAILNISGAVLLPVGMWVQFGFGAFMVTVGKERWGKDFPVGTALELNGSVHVDL